MASIKDIAKESGYAISTVSYALSGSKKVSSGVRDIILDTAKRLNYIPNINARALKSNKTYNIGVFVRGFSGPIHNLELEGIAEVLQETDYNMLVRLSKDLKKHLASNKYDLLIMIKLDNKLLSPFDNPEFIWGHFIFLL